MWFPLLRRAAIATLLATTVYVCILFPTPRWMWPVLRLLASPAGVLGQLLGGWFDVFTHRGSMWSGLLPFLVVSVPVYIAISYARSAGVAARRLTRGSLRDRSAFSLYFLSGACLGCLGGLALWAHPRFVGSSTALLAFVLLGSVASGWLVAVLRSVVR